MADLELFGGTVFGASQKPDDLQNVTSTGAPSEDAVLKRKESAYNSAGPMGQYMIEDAFKNGGNIAAQLWERAAISLGNESDPMYNYLDHADELNEGLPSQYRQFMQDGGWLGPAPKSLEEARELKDMILRNEEHGQKAADAGFRGMAAGMIAGIIDVDAPLMFLSGGTYSGVKVAEGLGRAGLEAGRLRSAVSMSAAGLEAGAYTGVISSGISPEGNWTDIPMMGLGGMVFGGAIGGLTKHDLMANTKLAETVNELPETMRDAVYDPTDVRVDAARTPVSDLKARGEARVAANANAPEGSSMALGADVTHGSTLNQKEYNIHQNMDASVRDYYEDSLEVMREVGAADQTEFEATRTGRVARRLKDTLDKTPFKSDYDALSALGESTIGSRLAYDLGENPAGYLRNNKSAARIQDLYEKKIGATPAIEYAKHFDDFATSKGFNRRQAYFESEAEEMFHREVMDEMAARLFDGNNGRSVNESVRKYADKLDEAYSTAGHIAKGREGEHSVLGFEDFKERSGYMPQSWSGEKFRNMMYKNFVTKEQLVDAIFNSYKKIHTNLDPDDLNVYAKALVSRFSAKGTGIDTSVLSVLSHDGKPFLAELLRNNGMPEYKIEKFIDALTGAGADKGKLGAAKSRLDIDPREAIPGTDMRIGDLMETNVQRNFEAYTRRISGAAALARKGIQRTDIPFLKQAWEQEMIAKNLKYSPEAFDGFMSYFTGGPVGGGIDPAIARIKRLTNLALLNGMGLPQLAEMGAVIGASGIEAFWHTAPTEVRLALQRKTSDLTKQLASIGVVQGYDHLLHNEAFALDMIRKNGLESLDMWDKVDKVLGSGQKVQGYISGFNAIKGIEQKVAVNSMVYKLHKMLKKGLTPANIRRLEDIFGNEWKDFQHYFTDGTVQVTGKNIDLALDKWSVEHSESFARGLNTHARQVIQQAMAGESTYWMHKDMGSLLTHLKVYPLEAFQKQFVRNARIMDNEAGLTFLYCLGLAGMVSVARKTLSGREEDIDFMSTANDAFGMSNMTGWIPMWTDPIASMLGMNDARFNHYGATGASSGILSTPAFIPTLNRMAHIPGAALKTITGNGSADDTYALQATPLIGNAYGFNTMFNALKNSQRADHEAEVKALKVQRDKETERKVVKKVKKKAAITEAENKLKDTGLIK